MRYLIDTHIFIWYAREKYKLTSDVLAIIDDYENDICISSESLKEIVQLWNKKPHIQKWWNSPLDVILIISHAITNRIPLISADSKFPFYRKQGLELIENKK